MEVICDYCARDVERLYPLVEGDGIEHICRACLDDVHYCLAGGRIPQDPEDA